MALICGSGITLLRAVRILIIIGERTSTSRQAFKHSQRQPEPARLLLRCSKKLEIDSKLRVRLSGTSNSGNLAGTTMAASTSAADELAEIQAVADRFVARGRWVSYLMVARPDTFPSPRFPQKPKELEQGNIMQFELRGWSRPVGGRFPGDTLASHFGQTLDSYVRACEREPFVDIGERISVDMEHTGMMEDGRTPEPGKQRLKIPTHAIARTDINLSAGMIMLHYARSVAYTLASYGLPPWDEVPWNDSKDPAPKLLHMSDLIFLNWEKANHVRYMEEPARGGTKWRYSWSMTQLHWVFVHPDNLPSTLTPDILAVLWKARCKENEDSADFPPGGVVSFDFEERPFLEILMGMPIIQTIALMLMQNREHWEDRIISRIYIARDEEMYDQRPMMLLRIKQVSPQVLHWLRTGLEADPLFPQRKL